jgi:hypothetical protein
MGRSKATIMRRLLAECKSSECSAFSSRSYLPSRLAAGASPIPALVWLMRRKRAPGLKGVDMLIPFEVVSRGSKTRGQHVHQPVVSSLFGVCDFRYVSTDYCGGLMVFTIRQGSKTCRCAACGARDVRPVVTTSPADGLCPSAAAWAGTRWAVSGAPTSVAKFF